MSRTEQSASLMRIGIIGAGIWGNNHALALTTHPRCTVAMICDRDEARARPTAERFGCAWTTSIGRAGRERRRCRDVATPDHLHREPTVAMLRAGKHVLVEKPLATTVADGPRDGGRSRRGRRAPDGRLPRALASAVHGRQELRGARRAGRAGDGVRAAQRHDLRADRDARRGADGRVPSGFSSLTRWTSSAGCSSGSRWRSSPRAIAACSRRKASRAGTRSRRWSSSRAAPSARSRRRGSCRTRYTNVVDNRLSLYGEKGGLELRNEPNLWVFTRPLPHAVLVGVGDAIRQGLGLSVRVDPVLRGLRRRRRAARGQRARRSRRDRDDRGDAEIAGREAAGRASQSVLGGVMTRLSTRRFANVATPRVDTVLDERSRSGSDSTASEPSSRARAADLAA